MHEIHIVITETEFRKASSTFESAPDVRLTVVSPDEERVAAAIRQNNAWAAILGVEKYSGELYAAIPRGGVIARFGVGHDGIDKKKATAAGIYVVNTPGVLENAVAEHTMALILAQSKSLPQFVLASQRLAWEPRPTFELRGRTMAIIGCGAIGRRVARAAAHGFGMTVIGHNRTRAHEDQLREQWGFSRITTDFADAVREADVVSLHVPGIPQNRHFISADTLKCFKAQAILINTSRGLVIDEIALFEALQTGALGGAALDVFEREPYVPRMPTKDLRTLPNVLLTPHVSAGTHEACARAATTVLENIRLAHQGNLAALNLINREILPAHLCDPCRGAPSGI